MLRNHAVHRPYPGGKTVSLAGISRRAAALGNGSILDSVVRGTFLVLRVYAAASNADLPPIAQLVQPRPVVLIFADCGVLSSLEVLEMHDSAFGLLEL